MSQYPVFVRHGDALDEIDALLRELGGPKEAGLRQHMYVTRADQTVVMTTGTDVPLAAELRARAAWLEPREP